MTRHLPTMRCPSPRPDATKQEWLHVRATSLSSQWCGALPTSPLSACGRGRAQLREPHLVVRPRAPAACAASMYGADVLCCPRQSGSTRAVTACGCFPGSGPTGRSAACRATILTCDPFDVRVDLVQGHTLSTASISDGKPWWHKQRASPCARCRRALNSAPGLPGRDLLRRARPPRRATAPGARRARARPARSARL